ncbi:MAG: glycoside hydrolase family 65 protein [Rhodoglobus sp.]
MKTEDPLDRHRFPLDEWALVETIPSSDDMGHTETLFAVGNGYVGMRGNMDEGRDGHVHGTFINGLHETWSIRHAEEAFGFARVGQTIVNVPDAKIIRLYVDDEPLILAEADVLDYERRLDFRDGTLNRRLTWRTPSGKLIRVDSRRLISFTDRHLAVISYEVTVLNTDASITISSQLLNREDAVDELDVHQNGLESTADRDGFDPRKAAAFTERVLQPRLKHSEGSRYTLGYRCTNSGMTVVAAMDHSIETDNEWEESGQLESDRAKHLYRVKATKGRSIRVVKTVSYHSSRGVPTRELADRSNRTLDRAEAEGIAAVTEQQRKWLNAFWTRTDVEVHGQPVVQQAVRWNLFQLAQASARADGQGVAAKGVSGSGYSGHYFWDTEIYVLPVLTYTSPLAARNALRFRHSILEQARTRARELNQQGALFPWRTINGEESSAYYAAGTAQYHIDADISFALTQYVAATGDTDFLHRAAIDILIETARMWADLGFWRFNGGDSFHIHGVTGPDEYTTVVNDNLYTNVMARANLRAAVTAVDTLREEDPAHYGHMAARLGLDDNEVMEWTAAAEAMFIPFDLEVGIHPQDAQFLERELWDLSKTGPERRPLLLHYHPLVIYRFQVIKQADVVLALFLQGDKFTADEKRADFDYYDPLTTGDSTLSAVVQSIIAAEVGYNELALKYFMDGLFVDLANLHHNTADGVHIASTGGVWSSLVFGFGGLRDHEGRFTLDPRLPESWEGLSYRIMIAGTRVRIDVTQTAATFTIEDGSAANFIVRGETVEVTSSGPVTVALQGHGPQIAGSPSASDVEGTVRADGSIMTASVPVGWLASTEPEPVD